MQQGWPQPAQLDAGTGQTAGETKWKHNAPLQAMLRTAGEG